MASQPVNQPVSRCDRPTNCLGRQLALSCPCQRWRCSIWFNLDAPLDARLPMRLAAAVFDTIYTKCRSFWRFAFVADSIVPRGPWPAPAPAVSLAAHCGTPLLLPQDNNKRLHFAATKLRHKFRHFVASLCSL